jgi:hypothetical protein
MSRWAVVVCCVALAAVLAVLTTVPVFDGDLFWHLAYGKQILDHGTLKPDPTLYSWTPATSGILYCSWLAEVVLQGVWRVGGLPALFGLRYLLAAAVVGLVGLTMRERGVLRDPVVWGAVLFAAVASGSGLHLKPEMFSLLFFYLALFVFARAQDDPRWYYGLPLLQLVWANTHGSFIVMLPLLPAALVVALWRRRTAPAAASDRTALRHMVGALLLSLLALGLTPYGLRYPVQIIDQFIPGTDARPDRVWNSADRSLLGPGKDRLGFIPYAVALLTLVGVALYLRPARDRFPDRVRPWLLLLAPYLALYLTYERATYFLPAVALYLVILLRTDAPPLEASLRSAATVTVTVIAAALALGAVRSAYTRPADGSWLGLGVSHINPVMESRFLERNPLGPRLYNSFNSGGYLLWRLYPRYRVMTDSRSYPYVDWFDDQFRFASGDSYEGFTRKYPASTALIDLANVRQWRHFLEDPRWQLVYYGPTAALFARKPVPTGVDRSALRDTGRFAGLRNADSGWRAFSFANAADDLPGAWAIASRLETELHHQVPSSRRRALRQYRQAHLALERGDYAAALAALEASAGDRETGSRERALVALLVAREAASPGSAAARGLDSRIGSVARPMIAAMHAQSGA